MPYAVIDNPFNRANYPALIGQVLDKPPAYAHVIITDRIPGRPADDSVAAGMIKGLVSHTINDVSYEEMNRIVRRLSRMTGTDRHAPQRVGAVLADELGEAKALQYVEKALANGLIKSSDYEPLRAAIILSLKRTEIPAPWAGAGARELIAGQRALQQDLGKIRQVGNRTLEKSADALNRDIEKLRRAWGLR